MTEGIVQKICRGFDSEIAKDIETQLIAEIKKEFPKDFIDFNYRSKLIGDTEWDALCVSVIWII